MYHKQTTMISKSRSTKFNTYNKQVFEKYIQRATSIRKIKLSRKVGKEYSLQKKTNHKNALT